jgi:hypothetical protein
LFNHCSVIYDGEVNTSRIKKQLAAEFDFAADGFIEVDGYTYNKTDVLEEIERPDFMDRLRYHNKLWQSKNILSILENNTGDLTALQQEFSKFQNDKDFDVFFSPWFAAPFNHICRGYLTEGKLYELSTLLLYEDFVQPTEKEEAFRSIRIFLDEQLRLFKNIIKENYNNFRPKIKPWRATGWDEFMNNLPDEFYDYKAQLAIELINLTVKIQKSNKEDCWAISNGLVGLRNLPNNLRETILNNDKVFNPKEKSTSYTWLIWVVIIVLKLLANGGCH